jgi:hypothetical protein
MPDSRQVAVGGWRKDINQTAKKNRSVRERSNFEQNANLELPTANRQPPTANRQINR